MALPTDRIMNVTELKGHISTGDLKQKSGSTLPSDSPLCPDFDQMDDFVDLDTTTYVNDGYTLDMCAPIGSLEFDDYINLILMTSFGSNSPIANEYFAKNVVRMSKDGTRCVIGTGDSDYHASNAGKLEVFSKSGDSWNFEQRLEPSDFVADMALGSVIHSVDIDSTGTRIIVGATLDVSGTSAAYIFVRSGSTWTQEAKIQSTDIQSGDFFGYSVSFDLNANKCIVGATKEDTGGSDVGAAYIFVRSGSTWTQEAKIQKATNKATAEHFGTCVLLSSDGTKVFVSTINKAYYYEFNGTAWSQIAEVIGSGVQNGDSYGASMAASTDFATIAISAPLRDYSTKDYCGTIFIFTRSGSTWTQVTELVAADKDDNWRMGYSISLSNDGNTLISSSYKEAAYVFKNNSGTWSQSEKITAETNYIYFGNSGISLDSTGTKALIGAQRDTYNSLSRAGTVHIVSIS